MTQSIAIREYAPSTNELTVRGGLSTLVLWTVPSIKWTWPLLVNLQDVCALSKRRAVQETGPEAPKYRPLSHRRKPMGCSVYWVTATARIVQRSRICCSALRFSLPLSSYPPPTLYRCLSKIMCGHTVPHFLGFLFLSLSLHLTLLLSSYTLPGVHLRFCVGTLFRTFLDISVLDLSTFSLLSSLSDSFLRFYNNFLFIFFFICNFLSDHSNY